MRNWFKSVLIGAGLLAASCEEGPTQTFAPAAPTAGSKWNDGKTPSSTDPTNTGFTGVSGGTNKQELCAGPQKQARWAKMVQAPIIPPNQGAGLDMAGGIDWHGLTIEEAEAINCQSDNRGDFFGDGNQTNSWGDNAEVTAEYLVSTRKIQMMTFWPGYQGTVKFHSADMAHTYEIGIGVQILKDGKPVLVDWIDSAKFRPFADEVFRAMMATFAPQLPVEPAGVNCLDSGLCQTLNFGDVAAYFVNPLNWGWWIDSQNAAQPVPSIPTRIDQIFIKLLAFAYLPPLLKMDLEGPVATQAAPLGKAARPCAMKLGLSYKDFLSDCVQVTGDAALDKVELNKVIGGLSHGTERFAFDIVGVDLNYTFDSLKPDAVVSDADKPQPNDTATEFSCDQSTLGNIANDWDPTGKTLDLHGAGAVYKEYARLVRETLLASAGIADGDTNRCLWPNPLPANFDPVAFEAGLPPYCTGFEGFVTASPSTGIKDRTNLGIKVLDVLGTLALGMKPGSTQAVWCMDPTGVTGLKAGQGFTACNAPYGAQGGIWSTSYNQVLRYFGKNKLSNLPVDVQDYRFFWKMYVRALLKYLLVANNTSTVPDLSKVVLNLNDLFYDSVGAGQFEQAEYIDRRNAKKGATAATDVPPTDVVIGADVKNGIFNNFDFSRDLLRGETAVYKAMLEDKVHDAPGQERSGLLTNIFGSPVIKNGWTDSTKGKSAYYCATNLDAANCDGQTPPLDASGNPVLDEAGNVLLAPYPGAFRSTAFSLGATGVTILNTYPGIQSAMVNVPLPFDPYNPAKKPIEMWNTLIPWVPKQPASGFSIPLNGAINKFIIAGQLDFSGTNITANIYYDDVLDPVTHAPTGGLQFLAVETTDFLGDVFLCQDSSTGDVLTARMYTPVAQIMQWLTAHPQAYASCGIVVRFSPFNNFVDYITSLTNGVRVNVTQGGGFGRVVDATLFVPGQ